MKNLYVFYYPNVGTVNQVTTHYLRVVTLIDSNQIITMYPTVNVNNIPVLNMLQNLDEISDNSTRKKSQIDKFNQKYKSFLK